MQNSYRKLHLGCGSVLLPGWLNIDLDAPQADMHLDLTKPFPLESNSVSHIFSEHFVEHVTRAEAVSFLKECYRLLADNGVIRITTPSLRFLVASYLAEHKEGWGEHWQPGTLCRMMNEGMRSWGHQFLYDAQELADVFTEAGFKTITFADYRKSSHEELCNLESRPFYNELIIEATKSKNAAPIVDFRKIKAIELLWAKNLQNLIIASFDFLDESAGIKADFSYFKIRGLIKHDKYIEDLEIRVEDYSQRLKEVANDWEARGNYIVELEKSIADLKDKDSEFEERGRQIDTLNEAVNVQHAKIHMIESELADCTNRNSELGRNNTELNTQLELVTGKLQKFEQSIYGRLVNKISRIHSTLRPK